MLAQAASPALDSTTVIVVVAVVAVLLILVAVLAAKRRSQALRRRFGSEYDRTLADTGSRNRAEQELAARETRVRKLQIQPLPSGARARYAEEWRSVQARFVDEPGPAVAAASALVANVMRDRGYPTDDAEQNDADLSVQHAGVLNNFRVAREISLRNDRGEASTEDLRSAMVAYRSLFADLLGTDPVSASTAKE
ncbi:MAG: hypothetical protein ABR591_07370 [Candidatus Velthaea sp.]